MPDTTSIAFGAIEVSARILNEIEWFLYKALRGVAVLRYRTPLITQ